MTDVLSISDEFAESLRTRGFTVVTCQNCAAPTLGLGFEVFSMQTTSPDRIAHFDVKRLRELVLARHAEPTIFTPGDTNYLWLMWWFANKGRHINLSHLDHIPADRLDEPGLRVWIMSDEISPGQPQPFPLLVDGSHRLLKKVMVGLPCAVYDATADERDQVLTTEDGVDRELAPELWEQRRREARTP